MTKKVEKMAERQFVGTWQLVSFEIRDEDGQVTYP